LSDDIFWEMMLVACIRWLRMLERYSRAITADNQKAKKKKKSMLWAHAINL
jgi:hypothetical protein